MAKFRKRSLVHERGDEIVLLSLSEIAFLFSFSVLLMVVIGEDQKSGEKSNAEVAFPKPKLENISCEDAVMLLISDKANEVTRGQIQAEVFSTCRMRLDLGSLAEDVGSQMLSCKVLDFLLLNERRRIFDVEGGNQDARVLEEITVFQQKCGSDLQIGSLSSSKTDICRNVDALRFAPNYLDKSVDAHDQVQASLSELCGGEVELQLVPSPSKAPGTQSCFGYIDLSSENPNRIYSIGSLDLTQKRDSEGSFILTASVFEGVRGNRDFAFSDKKRMLANLDKLVGELEAASYEPNEVDHDLKFVAKFSGTPDAETAQLEYKLIEGEDHGFTAFIGAVKKLRVFGSCSAYLSYPAEYHKIYAVFLSQFVNDHVNHAGGIKPKGRVN